MSVHFDPQIGLIIRDILGVLAALSVFVEITPIKVNPISFILRWIGKQTNNELLAKVNTLEAEVKQTNKKVDALEESHVINCRVRILTFADEIRRGIRHSKETFDQALSDIDVYERYCEEHKDFVNKKTVAAKAKILEVYSKCMDDNDFL